MSQQMQHSGGLAGLTPNKPHRSAWDDAAAMVDGAGFARRFYAELPLQLRGRLPWTRSKVRGLNVAMRELGDIRAADAPESDARRYVGTLDRFVDALYAVPVRCEDALAVAETGLDGREDVAECELRLALQSDDRVRLARALDAVIAADAECAAVYEERCTRRMRMKAALFETTGGR